MTKRTKVTVLMAAITAIVGGFGQTAAAATLFPGCPSGWYTFCVDQEQYLQCDFDGGSSTPTATCDALLYDQYRCGGDVGQEWCDPPGWTNDCGADYVVCVVLDS